MNKHNKTITIVPEYKDGNLIYQLPAGIPIDLANTVIPDGLLPKCLQFSYTSTALEPTPKPDLQTMMNTYKLNPSKKLFDAILFY